MECGNNLRNPDFENNSRVICKIVVATQLIIGKMFSNNRRILLIVKDPVLGTERVSLYIFLRNE